MKNVLTTFLLAMLVCLPLYAAEDETQDAGASEQPSDTGAGAAPDDQAQEAAAPATTEDGLTVPPSDEDFVPTVRITEDLPVAFPVDI